MNFFVQEKLTEELREALKKSRKESELNTIESQIRGLETRLKYNKSDLTATVINIYSLHQMNFINLISLNMFYFYRKSKLLN